jgi:hypothetical protein
MTLVLQHLGRATPLKYLILGLIPLVLSTCKVPPASDPPPPPPGGIRINTLGQPQSFFNGVTCRYAICQSGGDPNNPAERLAEGTFSLSGGLGVSEVEKLVSGEYDLYIAVDVDSDGYTFSASHPLDRDLHDAETNVTVDDVVVDRNLTLKTVAGEVTWTGSLSGELHIALCYNVAQGSFGYDYELVYTGITNATSAGFTFDAKGLSGGPYYLLGVLSTPPTWQRAGWYDDASAADSTVTPPVNLDSLQNSYDFFLSQ